MWRQLFMVEPMEEKRRSSVSSPIMEGKRYTALYPPLDPYMTGCMKVPTQEGIEHEIYFEQSGNKLGIPVLFLHGGSYIIIHIYFRPWRWQFTSLSAILQSWIVQNNSFPPKRRRYFLFLFENSGKSKPAACLVENTTWHLIEDIERLRKLLEIEKWVVFGGSWGSCLSLAYAESNPDKVLGLIVGTLRSL